MRLPGKITLILVTLMLAAWITPAEGQQVIAVTNSLNAVGAAAAVYVELADLSRGAVAAGPWRLPGPTATGTVVIDGHGSAWLTTGPSARSMAFYPQSHRAFLSRIGLAPFEAGGMAHTPVEPGWGKRLLGLWRDGRGVVSLVLLETPLDDEPAALGRVRLLTADVREPMGAQGRVWPLPAAPLDGCVAPGYGAVVLCKAPSGTGALLYGLPFDRETATPVELGVLARDLASVDGQIALSESGQHYFVILSGYPLGAPTAGAVSMVQRFEVAARAPEGGHLQLGGTLPRGVPALYAGNHEEVWALAMQSGEAAVQIMRLVPGEDGALRIRAQYALPIVEPGAQPLMAVYEDQVAVAVGSRLEIWPGGERRGAGANYDDTLRALAWTASGLYAGEADRVHAVDMDRGEPLSSVQLKSGRVVQLTPLPAEVDAGGGAMEADSAAEPVAPAPRLRVPFELAFRGQAAGRQVRALQINGPGLEGASWRIHFDPVTMPWLVADTLSGRGAGESYLTINPVFYDPTTTVTGYLDVHLDLANGMPAPGSPARVFVRVDAAPSGARKVLWLLENEDGPEKDFGSVLRMLSGPPFFLSHATGATPFQGRLEDYAIVVLGGEAAARGAVTRQRLLDYTARGGAFLLLASHGGERVRPLAQWLHALGIYLGVDRELPAGFQVMRNAQARETIRGLSRHWPMRALPDACVVTGPLEHVAVATTDGHALLLAREYSYGRLAVLASVTPLAGPNADLLFARSLFQWLQRAGMESADWDDAGLPGEVEDVIGGGVHDPGSTHLLRGSADVPGGGAPSPGPGEEAPVVLRVDGTAGRAKGPAEGGAVVAIYGRNFTQGCSVWFGEAPAPEWRFLSHETAYAVAPAQIGGAAGPVAVRVVMGATPGPGVPEGQLPDAFLYTPRSRVPISLQAVASPAGEGGLQRGNLHVQLDVPDGAAVGKLLLVFTTGGVEEIDWHEPEWVRGVPPSVKLLLEPLSAGQFVVRTPELGSMGFYGGLMFAIPWQAERAVLDAGAVRVTLAGAFVLTRHGQAIDVALGPPVAMTDAGNARKKDGPP